jgi:hypothetical protein
MQTSDARRGIQVITSTLYMLVHLFRYHYTQHN